MTRLLVTCLAVAVTASCPAAFAAESATPTRQQDAYGLTWASYLAPEDMPPVEQRAGICMVDSGVDVTPDLPEDRPEGPVVGRVVSSDLVRTGDVEDGTGGRSAAGRHGTLMASLTGAVPGNDWGTAGIVPWVRILSVRALRKDAEAFEPRAYEDGLRECQTRNEDFQIAAATIALSCECTATPEEQAYIDESVVRLQRLGVSVLAAAGNDGGSTLSTPASTSGVIPVAAGDTAPGGGLCEYATWTRDVLVGPGCGVDLAGPSGVPAHSDGAGSSGATMAAAATVALLKTLSPQATREDVEQALLTGARVIDGRPVLDGEGAARALGLAAVVDRARARIPVRRQSAAPGAELDPATTPVTQRRLPAPKLRARRLRGGRIAVRVFNRPHGVELEVRAGSRFVSRAADRIVVRGRGVKVVRARLIADDALSPTVRVRVRRR